MTTRLDNQGHISVLIDPEGTVSASLDPSSMGPVSPDPEGMGAVSPNPSGKGFALPGGVHTTPNHYGSKCAALGQISDTRRGMDMP